MKITSIYFRLGYNFVIITIIPLLFMGFGIYYTLSISMNNLMFQKNNDIIETLKRELSVFLDDTERDLAEIQKIIYSRIVLEKDLQNYLDIQMISNPQLDMIQIIDENSHVKMVTPYNKSFLNLDLSGHYFIRDSKVEGKNYWSQVFVSPLNGNSTIALTRLNRDYGIVFYINLDFLANSIVRESEDNLGFTFILDSKGNFIAHPDPLNVSVRENMRNVPEVRAIIESEIIENSSSLWEDNILSLKRLSPTDWILGFSQSQKGAFSIIRTFRNTGFIVGILTLLIAFALAFFTLRDTVTPITRLIQASKSVSSGDYSTDLGESHIKEVGELSDQFKQMVLSVQERENELEKLQNYLSDIVDSMPSILISVDNSGRVTMWNNKAESVTGIKAYDAMGELINEVLPVTTLNMDNVMESIHFRKIIDLKKKSRESAGEIIYENITIYPLTAEGVEGAVVRIDEVTSIVRMEEMMIQSERMLSIGGLAAGMAHEINNPLAGIIQTSSVMANRLGRKMDLPVNREAAEKSGTDIESIKKYMELRGIHHMLDSISMAGKRASAIIDNILSFSRKSDGRFSSHEINDIIDKTLDLVATDYDLKKNYDFKSITITKEYEVNLPYISCEVAKIQQVLMNLFRNGAQAMQELKNVPPVFIIKTSFDENSKMISIEIKDNGPGMIEEVKKRVFEPFYTTKPVGLGTGLGLSVSYFIITENHSGEMFVESEPGKGSSFIIRLPVTA